MRVAHEDASNGYEAVAAEFMVRRERSSIGVETVRSWARALPPSGSILDLGCGHGSPLSTALAADGFAIHGVDASPTLVEAFRRRLPGAPVTCEAVEGSHFFGRTFDGVLAVGLIFLLPPEAQQGLIRRVAAALNRGGRFLFTAPPHRCTWSDVLTGRESLSLGAERYETIFSAAGLIPAGTYVDEGANHYYDTRKP